MTLSWLPRQMQYSLSARNLLIILLTILPVVLYMRLKTLWPAPPVNQSKLEGLRKFTLLLPFSIIFYIKNLITNPQKFFDQCLDRLVIDALIAN